MPQQNEAVLEIKAEVADALSKLDSIGDRFESIVNQMEADAGRVDFDPTSESARELVAEVDRLEAELSELSDTADAVEGQLEDTFDLRAKAADALQRIEGVVGEFESLATVINQVSGLDVTPESIEDLQLQLQRVTQEFVTVADSGLDSFARLQEQGVDTSEGLDQISGAADRLHEALLAAFPAASELKLEGIKEAADDVENLTQRVESLRPAVDGVSGSTSRASRHISTLLTPSLTRLTGVSGVGNVAAIQLEDSLQKLGDTADSTGGKFGGLALRVGGLITILVLLIAKYDKIREKTNEVFEGAFAVSDAALERQRLQMLLAAEGVDTFGLSLEKMRQKLSEVRDEQKRVREETAKLIGQLTGADLAGDAEILGNALQALTEQGQGTQRIVDAIGEEAIELVEAMQRVGQEAPEELQKLATAARESKFEMEGLREEWDRIAERFEQGLPEQVSDDAAQIVVDLKKSRDALLGQADAIEEAFRVLQEQGELSTAFARKLGEQAQQLVADFEDFGEVAPEAIRLLAAEFGPLGDEVERNTLLQEAYNEVVSEAKGEVDALTESLREQQRVQESQGDTLEDLIGRQEELEQQQATGSLGVEEINELGELPFLIDDAKASLEEQGLVVEQLAGQVDDAAEAYEEAGQAAETFAETGEDISFLGQGIDNVAAAAGRAGQGLAEGAAGGQEFGESVQFSAEQIEKFLDRIDELEQLTKVVTEFGNRAKTALNHMRPLLQVTQEWKDCLESIGEVSL